MFYHIDVAGFYWTLLNRGLNFNLR